jgi:hypothetical protein
MAATKIMILGSVDDFPTAFTYCASKFSPCLCCFIFKKKRALRTINLDCGIVVTLARAEQTEAHAHGL